MEKHRLVARGETRIKNGSCTANFYKKMMQTKASDLKVSAHVSSPRGVEKKRCAWK